MMQHAPRCARDGDGDTMAAARRRRPAAMLCWILALSQGVGLRSTYMPICLAGVVGGRLWLTGFPLWCTVRIGVRLGGASLAR